MTLFFVKKCRHIKMSNKNNHNHHLLILTALKTTSYHHDDDDDKITKCAFFRARPPRVQAHPTRRTRKNDNGYHLQQNPVSSTIAPDWRL
ncbi:hypothetical protein SE963_21205 [Escherichia coli]|nr:hypothetical protein [Escherichia coli]